MEDDTMSDFDRWWEEHVKTEGLEGHQFLGNLKATARKAWQQRLQVQFVRDNEVIATESLQKVVNYYGDFFNLRHDSFRLA